MTEILNTMRNEGYAERAQAMTRRARAAATTLRSASTAQKDRALYSIADALQSESPSILDANAQDLAAGKKAGLSPSLLDRLLLDKKRLDAIATAVRQVAAQVDPVGAISELVPRPSGISVGRMRIPLGTIFIVYESRPNVTIDAAVLALKAGNAVILRGGREAVHSNQVLAKIVQKALTSADLPADAALLVDDPDRELLYALLARAGEIDLAIPRGGTGLIDAVNAHARVPVIQHYQGICHVYLHAGADLEKARAICVNSKVQRPGVCNAAEGILVDEAIALAALPALLDDLIAAGVEVRGCKKTLALVPARTGLIAATDQDFDTEFYDLRCCLKIVDGYEGALEFLDKHSSSHTETICTEDHSVAMRFLHDVDASCVLVNASTRFNDGGELGLGAELGISTSKLHAYGPMGVEELTTRKFVVLGHGETRS